MSTDCMFCKMDLKRHQAESGHCPLIDQSDGARFGWGITRFKLCAHKVEVQIKPVNGYSLKCMSCGRKSKPPAKVEVEA